MKIPRPASIIRRNHRQADGAGGAAVHFALDADLALMLGNEAPADDQAQTGAPGLGGEKRGEEVLQLLRGDAVAGVGDFEHQVVILDLGADGQVAALGHGLQGVLKEIDQHLADLSGVKGKRRNPALGVEVEDHGPLFEAAVHEFRHFPNQGQEVPHGFLRRRAPGEGAHVG